jgi:hypothetical protein
LDEFEEGGVGWFWATILHNREGSSFVGQVQNGLDEAHSEEFALMVVLVMSDAPRPRNWS